MIKNTNGVGDGEVSRIDTKPDHCSADWDQFCLILT